MKFLIVGLGNIGSEYEETRHNIGFKVVDAMAKEGGASWTLDTSAYITEVKHKGKTLILIKPTTYMNRSGKAVQYWMTKHKIPKENILVVVDDLHLDFGTLRLRAKGSDAGHNGLKDIDVVLGGNDYARLKFGIGSKFHKGQQVDYVLGKWSKEEYKELNFMIQKAAEASKSLTAIGMKFTMEQYNKSWLTED